LIEHVKKYHDSKLFLRFVCFSTEFAYLFHISGEINSQSTVFDTYLIPLGDILGDQAEPDTNVTSILKCNECTSEFPSFHEFKLHVFKQHVKNPDYVECEICFELVYSAFRLFAHRKLVHPGKIGDYKKTCSIFLTTQIYF
jgi:hypothetical protein